MYIVNELISNNLFLSKHLPDTALNITQEIRSDDVQLALEKISIKVHNKWDVLVLFSALNLLNAAIKNKQYKNRLSYHTIKGHATRIIGYCITAKSKKYLEDIYINKDENYCAYARCLGLQFSFHNIGKNDTINRFIDSPDNIIGSWDKIKLQPIAPAIFRKAIALQLEKSKLPVKYSQ
jgi:hypothetical protein